MHYERQVSSLYYCTILITLIFKLWDANLIGDGISRLAVPKRTYNDHRPKNAKLYKNYIKDYGYLK
uniref:Uncharacterized protein n=1 Tax=Romanomermis culicivorax TaxID=13658 RepID=A0A915I2R8_ROMCU